MRVGYAFWGFMSDYKIKNGKEVSAPDGCYLYVWSIVQELLRRGHEVYRMMPDRDEEAVKTYGKNAFYVFSPEKRYNAYANMVQVDLNDLPDLDLLILEWRWPIPGRNCEVDKNSEAYQPDLDIQNKLIEHYRNTNTLVIASDQDYKMTPEDVAKVDVVIDWGYKHGIHVDMPFDFNEIKQFVINKNNIYTISYVGSRYERDWAITKYLASAAKFVDVTCFGNWLEANRQSDKDWPEIKFPESKRISNEKLKTILSQTLVTPLLAKQEYCDYGLMTCRIVEAILFGCIPLGISEFYGITRYLPFELVVNSGEEIVRNIEYYKKHKQQIIEKLRESLSWMDAKHYVNVLENLYNERKHLKRR